MPNAATPKSHPGKRAPFKHAKRRPTGAKLSSRGLGTVSCRGFDTDKQPWWCSATAEATCTKHNPTRDTDGRTSKRTGDEQPMPSASSTSRELGRSCVCPCQYAFVIQPTCSNGASPQDIASYRAISTTLPAKVQIPIPVSTAGGLRRGG